MSDSSKASFSKRLKIVISMPLYNEAHGISSFVQELFATLKKCDLTIYLNDDRSTDDTKLILRNLKADYGAQLVVNYNERNLGHGPTTLSGISRALEAEFFDYLITVGVDGNFRGNDIAAALFKASEAQVDILEGVRLSRSDPTFRRLTTRFCQLIVKSVSGKKPGDANTPLRVYSRESLEIVMNRTPLNLVTPNLYISSLSRILCFKIEEFPISVIPSRSLEKNGTTWRQRFRWLPSRRFFMFCIVAVIQWKRVCIPNLSEVIKSG